MSRTTRHLTACSAAVALLCLAAFSPTFAKHRGGRPEAVSPGVQILPPDEKFAGKTYPEWAAAFWQWAFALPAEGHPFQNADFDFSAGQKGPVWFWAAPDGPATIHATLPHGKALFLTLRDVDASSLEEPPFFGATEDEQRAVANFFADHIEDVFCVIDGLPVEDLDRFRFETDQFTFDAPTPWVFGATGGRGTAVGDGYFLMLKLARGRHSIHYGGTFRFEAGELDEVPLEFVKEITIELTVE